MLCWVFVLFSYFVICHITTLTKARSIPYKTTEVTNDFKIKENERNEKKWLNSYALNKGPFYDHLFVSWQLRIQLRNNELSDIQKIGSTNYCWKTGITCCSVVWIQCVWRLATGGCPHSWFKNRTQISDSIHSVPYSLRLSAIPSDETSCKTLNSNGAYYWLIFVGRSERMSLFITYIKPKNIK